jgi:predicted transcriptional regulator
VFDVFARRKPCTIMKLLRDQESQWHISRLARGSDTTFVYTSHIVGILQEKGFVTIEAKGKKRIVKLTEKGMKTANAIDDLMKICEG